MDGWAIRFLTSVNHARRGLADSRIVSCGPLLTNFLDLLITLSASAQETYGAEPSITAVPAANVGMAGPTSEKAVPLSVKPGAPSEYPQIKRVNDSSR